ncbi:MAG: HAD-IIIA family hydrolase [Desulfobulbaceae bacterium]|uniref:HAD-IIIA family hydrolase n=1 Tax=Candidatus Desulfobia pelagia TaxID=2841692 RepID=A0A8J6ND49_9BACT|nr:HAD-IIIA family hydrolase [Candidatus Desulfobia pelagia]
MSIKQGDGSCVSPGNGYISDCDLTQALLQKASARNEMEGRGYAWKNCLAKAKKIKLLLLDVDGVLTDGSIAYTDEGREVKTFSVKDGFGMNMLQKTGVEIGLITARSSEALTRRAKDLRLKYVYQGVREKVAMYEQVKEELNLEAYEIAYMGDDWLDLALLSRVGFSATVADGVPEVQKIVDYVAKCAGGRGAVREVCELIIDAKGEYDTLLNYYLAKV